MDIIIAIIIVIALVWITKSLAMAVLFIGMAAVVLWIIRIARGKGDY